MSESTDEQTRRMEAIRRKEVFEAQLADGKWDKAVNEWCIWDDRRKARESATPGRSLAGRDAA
ncbi:MAG: hypothetical protein KGL39_32390 [Patescibacteria group bacterium]|nr:hypothetical protein [Patescibacteria group bacterium]